MPKPSMSPDNLTITPEQKGIWAKIPILLVYLFAVSIVLKFRLVNNIVTGAIILYCISQFKSFRLKRDLFFWNTCCFFALYLLGLLNSENTYQAFRNIERLLPLLIMPLFFSVLPGLSGAEKRNTLLLFVFSCLIVSWMCIGQTFSDNYSKGLEFAYHNAWYYSAENLIQEWGIHQSYFAIYIGLCINIILYLIDKHRKYVVLSSLLIIYFFVFQLFLAARLPLLLSVLTFSLYLGRILSRRMSLVSSALILIGFYLLFFVSVLQVPIIREKFKGGLAIHLDQDNKKFSSDLRLYKWSSTMELIKSNWLTGVGTGDLRDELEKIYRRDNCDNCFINRYNPHNQYLDSWATLGLLGFILFISNLALPLVTAVKRRNLLYFNFLILFLAFSITESTLLMNKGVIFFSFFNALFYYKFKEA